MAGSASQNSTAKGASQSAAKLYTPRLLSLSAELAAFPLDEGFGRTAEARSRTCGSTLKIGVDMDSSGHLIRIGMLVSACAIGQSSAAVLALAAKGRSASEFTDTSRRIEAWLAGQDAAPDWPGFDALVPALPHSGRHGALLLPWHALIRALSTEPLSSAASSR